MKEKIFSQEKVYDPERKLFEFNNGDKFWMVATSEEEARQCLVEDYAEDNISDMDVREVTRETHFEILDEENGERIDIWNMIDRDATDETIKVPYMVASTIL